MKKYSDNRILSLSPEELLSKFIEITIMLGEANERLEISKFNRIYKEALAVVRELRSRPGDARSRLLSLYNHPNLQVRHSAASWSYALDPKAAEAAFRSIKDSQRFPWAGDAGMSLSLLEMGISKLPEDPW